MSDAFLVSLFEHKAWANRGLIEALRAAAAEADRMQMAIILLTLDHTARVDQAFKARLAGEAQSLDTVVGNRRPDIDELGARMAATDAWFIDYASRVTQAELAETVEFDFISDDDHGRMTRGEILAHLITHSASHRGGIGKMLEAIEVRGASDMVTSFVSEGRAGTVGFDLERFSPKIGCWFKSWTQGLSRIRGPDVRDLWSQAATGELELSDTADADSTAGMTTLFWTRKACRPSSRPPPPPSRTSPAAAR